MKKNVKSRISIVLGMIVLLMFVCPVSASSMTKVLFNGVTTDIVGDYQDLPAVEIMQKMGYAVSFNDSDQMLEATKGARKIYIRLGECQYRDVIDGMERVHVTQSGMEYSQRAYFPYPYDMIKAATGCTVMWDAEHQTILVTVESEQEPAPEASDAISVLVTGTPVIFDVKPQIIRGSTMVPMRAVMEKMGYSVAYDTSTGTITARDFRETITMNIGNRTITTGYATFEAPLAPAIIDGRALIPLRAFGEATGYTVEWDEKTRTAHLDKPIAEQKSVVATDETVLQLTSGKEVSGSIAFGPFHSVGLRKDGTVLATGTSQNGECRVGDWKAIVAVAAGMDFSVGLKQDGTVVSTGHDVSGWKDIVAVSAGSSHVVGLKKNGTVVAAGFNSDGQCNVAGWNDIIAISAGGYQTLGLKKDGTVVAVGSNQQGQCNVASWKDIIAISTGEGESAGVRKDGTVVAVGENNFGQCDVSQWSDIVAISANRGTVGLKKDGTVVATGLNGWSESDVLGWTGIVAVITNGSKTLGLKTDGTVVATGLNPVEQFNPSEWINIGIH